MAVGYNPEHITYFGETDFRNQRTRFGIKSRDRTRHMYVIGKSGVGKSTLLENMAIQDIQNGEGVAILDPHGSFADKMLDYVPEERIKDVIYFAPFDTENPISFNVLEDVGADKRHLVVSGLMSTFKKIWVDAWSARMEYILTNTLLALLEYPDATLLGVNRMLSDKDFRKKVVDNITDTSVKAFWVEEFAKYTERMAAEAVPAIQNKIGQLTANPLVRNIIGQPKSSFDIRKAMDEQKILIINLSKGRIGDTNTSLLGSMMITKIYLAAMSRAEERPQEMAKLPNFYFYVDEFQSFANETFADILAEARKYKLALIIAHQYVAQMEEKVRDAVFGNVGTTVSFRVGPLDAELLEKVFAPQFTENDLINLGMAQVYLSLMINDIGSQPFSARTLPPLPHPAISYRTQCIEASRKSFAVTRADVEDQIKEFYIKDTPPESEYPKKQFTPRDGGQGYAPRNGGQGGQGQYQNQYPRQQYQNQYPSPRENQREDQRENREPYQNRYNQSAQQPPQQPFKKAFSAITPAPTVVASTNMPHSNESLKETYEPRVHAKPIHRTAPTEQKTLFKRVTEQTVVQNANGNGSGGANESSSPALQSLLASLNFEAAPAKSTATSPSIPKPTPTPQPETITDDKPFAQPPRPPVRSEERAIKESSKDLLREALAKVAPQPVPQPAPQSASTTPSSSAMPVKPVTSTTEVPISPQNSQKTQSAISPNSTTTTPSEVPYEQIRKVLE